MSTSAAFDLPGVEAQVEGVLASTGVEDARKLWEETLSAWADEYSRLLDEASPPLSAESRRPYEEGLVDLWLAYAAFERRLRQWKQAVKVFESATTDVIGEKAPKLWVEYGRFCRERGKFANAQKVYLRAVEVLVSKSERDVIWAEFLEALKAKGGGGAEGIETVAHLKAMLNVPEEEEEEGKEEVHKQKEGQQDGKVDEAAAESSTMMEVDELQPATPTAEEEAETAVAPVDDAVARVLAAVAGAEAADFHLPAPDSHQSQIDTMNEVSTETKAGIAAAAIMPETARIATASSTAGPTAATATLLPPPSQLPPPQSTDLEPPPLLFTTEALLNMEDAYGTGLSDSTLESVKALLADPTILDIIEGQWLIQAMKQQLASTIVTHLDDKHAEAAQRLALRHAQAQQQLSSLPSIPPSFHKQLEQERHALALACERERRQVGAQLSIELWQLLEAQQAVLGEGEGGAGLPEVKVTRDRAAVATQQQVLRVVTANMQLYHFHQRRQALTEEVEKHAELTRQLQGPPAPPPAAAGGGGDSASPLVLPPPTKVEVLPSPFFLQSSSSPSSSSPLPSNLRGGGNDSSKRERVSRWETAVPLTAEDKVKGGIKGKRNHRGGEESCGEGGGRGGGGGGRGSRQSRAKIEGRGNTRERGAAAAAAAAAATSAASPRVRSPPRRSSRRNGGREKGGERGKGGGRESEEPNLPPNEDNRTILRKMMRHFK